MLLPQKDHRRGLYLFNMSFEWVPYLDARWRVRLLPFNSLLQSGTNMYDMQVSYVSCLVLWVRARRFSRIPPGPSSQWRPYGD